MRLPRKVKVGQRWYSVEVVEAMREKAIMGEICYTDRKITVASTSSRTGRRFSQQDFSETFWHELVHAILNDMDHQLASNEKFVEAFSHRLAKAINTAKFQ